MTDSLTIGPSIDTLGDKTVVESSNFDSGILQIDGDAIRAEAAAAKEEQALIAGKFKTQDDLVKAYKELESKLGAPKTEAPAEAPEGDSENAEAPEGDAEKTETADAPKLDFEALSAEYAEKGELSPESFESLEKAGIPKAIAETYVAGLQAIQTIRGGQLYEAAGGKDAYDALVKWGSQNLPEAQRNAFDAAINTAILEGDMTAASLMIKGVQAQMGGSEPRLLSPTDNSRSASSPDAPFADRSEMVKAMSDPRYRRDPDYVQQVQRRLAASTFA